MASVREGVGLRDAFALRAGTIDMRGIETFREQERGCERRRLADRYGLAGRLASDEVCVLRKMRVEDLAE